VRQATLETRVLEHARLQADYWREAQRGTSMSVHERYQRELAGLRREIQQVQMPCPLGEILVDMGFVARHDVDWAVEEQHKRKEHALLGEILLEQGLLSPSALIQALRRQLGLWDPTRLPTPSPHPHPPALTPTQE